MSFAQLDYYISKLKIDNEGRLSEITALKQKAPHLKVLLSVGGWESGRFSEMAANEQYRLSFANDCRRQSNSFSWMVLTSTGNILPAVRQEYHLLLTIPKITRC